MAATSGYLRRVGNKVILTQGGGGASTYDAETIDPRVYVANPGQTEFQLPVVIDDENILIVFINNAIVDPDLYSVDGNILAFTAAPGDGAIVQVHFLAMQSHLQSIGYYINGYQPYQNLYTAAAGQDEFYLDVIPTSSDYIIVAVNGVLQFPDAYTLDGDLLTLGTARSAGDQLWIMITSPVSFTQVVDDPRDGDIKVWHNGTDGYVETSEGDIILKPATGDVYTEGRLWNSVYNDYADSWPAHDGVSKLPGMFYSIHDGKLFVTETRADAAAFGICSDTFGQCMGSGVSNSIPVAVAGYVLAYVDKTYPAGTCLVPDKHGILTKAQWYEILFNRPVAKYMRYEWRRTIRRHIDVNSRHWVKVI